MSEPTVARDSLLALESSCIPTAVYQFKDRRVVTVVVSDGFCELLGFDTHVEAMRVMDDDMYVDTHPDDVARIANAAVRFATEGGEYEAIYRTRDVVAGEGWHVLHARGKHVFDEDGVRYAVVWYTDEGSYVEGMRGEGLASAISATLREESLLRESHYDHLTGLPSMGYFFELAEARRATLSEAGGQAAMLFVNLCGLRRFNRQHGFAEGDTLIHAVAREFAQSFGNENCGYLGHGHFAAVVDGAMLDDVVAGLISRVRTTNGGRSLSIHVGVCLDEGENTDASTALDRASAACDACRTTPGSAMRRFERSMLAAEDERLYLVDNLDRAIEEGWIQVYNQPIVRTANGRVCDEEALARWVDPELGLLNPGQFIPALEEAGVIWKLDLHVLDQVLNKMARLREAGLYIVPSSINLSRSDFDACDMVEEICRRVDAAGVSHDKIVIEITESVVGSDFAFMVEQVRRFHERGFSVWMDDFGSEYSSLDNLQSIPFNLIKLDRGFMREFARNERSRIILAELVRMAIALGVETVAEGVETLEQVEFLREIGCTKLQGFYFTQPLPTEEVLRRYETGTAIGFENPEEADYYAALGRVNLHDLSLVLREEAGVEAGAGDDTEVREGDDVEAMRAAAIGSYFDTLPMAVIEFAGGTYSIARCNASYRSFLRRIGVEEEANRMALPVEGMIHKADVFVHTIRACAEQGGLRVIDEMLPGGATVHAIVRRVSTNPVTGSAALVVAVLSFNEVEGTGEGASFSHIARALTADYIDLYYVDLESEDYVHYLPGRYVGQLEVERSGKGFFARARADALQQLYEDDRASFVAAFTKEKVIRALDERGSFKLTYRVMLDDVATYVIMKVTRMARGDSHVVVGVSNVDAHMRQRDAVKRLQEERATLVRVAALSGTFVCIYSVDLESDRYTEFIASDERSALELPQVGEDFFGESRDNIARVIHPEDHRRFLDAFTRDRILGAAERGEVFQLRYRLVMGGAAVPVVLRAAVVEERGGRHLIVGVTRGE